MTHHFNQIKSIVSVICAGHDNEAVVMQENCNEQIEIG